MGRSAISAAAAVACAMALYAEVPDDAQPGTAITSTASDRDSEFVATLAGTVNEENLRHWLAGKPLYLRGGYLDDSLNFDDRGRLISRSAVGSYTLCAIQIDKVRMTKRKIELQGIRYGLHFGGQTENEDVAKAFDRVRITPRKKMVRITIEREAVQAQKKQKEKKAGGKVQPSAEPGPTMPASAPTAGNQVSAKPAARSAEEAAGLLKRALDQIFAPGLDNRSIAAMPDFWRLYYEAAAVHSEYRPQDPAVLTQSAVDKKAKLVTAFEPASNEYAQTAGVAGMALYYAVVGVEGKVGEIAVRRPIGFGLDENAVEAIRKAKFEPAIKDGKPVPVLLDLALQFRIYSNRTAVLAPAESTGKEAEPVLPGPYTVQGQ
jgi:TonB family protein